MKRLVAKYKNTPYEKRLVITTVFTMCVSSAMYFDFFGKYTMFVSIALAAFAFTELGIAIYGLVKTKRREHCYRNIKIISFASALTAIMTARGFTKTEVK